MKICYKHPAKATIFATESQIIDGRHLDWTKGSVDLELHLHYLTSSVQVNSRRFLSFKHLITPSLTEQSCIWNQLVVHFRIAHHHLGLQFGNRGSEDAPISLHHGVVWPEVDGKMGTLLHSGEEDDWLGGQGGCHQGKGGTCGDDHVGVHLVVHSGLHAHVVHEGNTLGQVISVGRGIAIHKYFSEEFKTGGRLAEPRGSRVGAVGVKVVVDWKMLQHHVQLGFQATKECTATPVLPKQRNVARAQLRIHLKKEGEGG